MSIMANVICCNDSIEAVFLGTEGDAEKLKGTLEKRDYKRHVGVFGGTAQPTIEDYRLSQFWHVCTATLLGYDGNPI